MIGSFPVMFLAVMLYTGSARIEFGAPKKSAEEVKKVETVHFSAKSESLAVANSRTWQALQQEKIDIEKDRQKLADQQNNVAIYTKDLDAKKGELEAERKKIESLVGKSDVLDKKKTAQLAKVYAAMKPAEAAQIISTMDDALAAHLLESMSDDRQKAKIIAALGQEKALKISEILGGSTVRK